MLALVLVLLPAYAAETFDGHDFYIGDIHAHTRVSGDAASNGDSGCSECGAFDAVFDIALANDLDFLALSDHTNGKTTADDSEYEALLALMLDMNAPDAGFVTIPAAEIAVNSGSTPFGHKTLLMFGENVDLESFTRVDASPSGAKTSHLADCSLLWTWMSGLEATFGPALLIPHHPAGTKPMPTDWSCHKEAWEPAVEVYSVHGSSMGDGSGFDPLVTESEAGTVHSALDPDRYGLRLGFVAGTDRHDTRPGDVCALDQYRTNHQYGGGLTVVVLDEGAAYDRSAIYGAFVARRTYATSGPFVPVTVRYEQDGHAIGGLGDDLAIELGTELTVEVRVPGTWDPYVTGVRLVDPDGYTAMSASGTGWSATVDPSSAPAWVYVALTLDGDALWSGTGCDDGGSSGEEWLWMSPSTLALVDDLDGDGVSAADGDCAPTDAAIAPGLAETWYDGTDSNCDGASDYDADGDGEGAAPWGPDCDDTDPDTFSGGVDPPYDGVDADCDGWSDYDADQDGHDAAEYGGDDCADLDAARHPGAVEIYYDGLDGDCAGGSDLDADGDGFDSSSHGGDDCDDADASVWPGAPDTPHDGIVHDCDATDEFDGDGDGYAAASAGGADCDDARSDVFPGAPDLPYDGLDANCDGESDYDADRDGFDGAGSGGADCADDDPTRHPGAAETPYDGVDGDCDGGSDFDSDGDGFDSASYGGADCDDADPDTWPGAPDAPYDGVITDCVASDEYDADGDGAPVYADCDDARSDVHPGAPDAPYDGLDANCDGRSDFDVDGDGFDASGFGGEDCDDTRDDVNPDAIDRSGDGVDQDCDGAEPSRGCSTVPGGAPSALLLLLAMTAARRARRPRPGTGAAGREPR